MPIPLERMSRIIQAADIYLQRDKLLRSRIHHVCALVASGRMTAEAAIDEIGLHLKVTPDYIPAESVIVEERTRFNLTYKRSMSERLRAQARRKGLPYTSKNTAPVIAPIITTSEPIPEQVQNILADMEREDKEIDDWLTQPPPENHPDEPKYPQDVQDEADKIVAQIKRQREYK